MEFFPALPVLCGLSIVLVLLPLPWHWKARNVGTLLWIGWTLIGNIIFLVNSILWHGNVGNHAPVWCDITVKLGIGLAVGLTAASLCINRRLYNIATIKSVSISAKSKRRETIIELLLGVGLPCLIMALSYVVQGQRYNIIEDIGCWPNVYFTALSFVLIYIWPVMIAVASFIYCGLTIRAFLKTRQQFNQILSNSHSGVNMSRYFRLMALASSEMAISLPLSIWTIVRNLQQGELQPWVSWADLKYKFSGTPAYPRILIELAPGGYGVFMPNLFAAPVCGFMFFIYFGLGGETFAEYKRFFWKIVGVFGFKPRAPKPNNNYSSYQGRTISSSVATESRDHTRFPSLPDLDQSLEKSSVDVDLEAAKLGPKA